MFRKSEAAEHGGLRVSSLHKSQQGKAAALRRGSSGEVQVNPLNVPGHFIECGPEPGSTPRSAFDGSASADAVLGRNILNEFNFYYTVPESLRESKSAPPSSCMKSPQPQPLRKKVSWNLRREELGREDPGHTPTAEPVAPRIITKAAAPPKKLIWRPKLFKKNHVTAISVVPSN